MLGTQTHMAMPAFTWMLQIQAQALVFVYQCFAHQVLSSSVDFILLLSSGRNVSDSLEANLVILDGYGPLY